MKKKSVSYPLFIIDIEVDKRHRKQRIYFIILMYMKKGYLLGLERNLIRKSLFPKDQNTNGAKNLEKEDYISCFNFLVYRAHLITASRDYYNNENTIYSFIF